ncbi:MAG TPA: type I-E CRISPR-associated protein Cas7/Cse4/CasC [Sedimentisphaerales bacterium]|nr:type I-E CRISPR-associated protein Cas7/Cse4/CasC [Sedimentisphaerales bacterium]
MFVQIHMLQSMPPGNLNRDETGQPKKCLFGGVTRGRISSQCLKRNIRHSTQFKERFGDALADRTQYLPQMVADELRKGKSGIPEDEIGKVMSALASRFSKEIEGEGEGGASADGGDAGKTPQLVFFPQPFAKRIAELVGHLRKTRKDVYDVFIGCAKKPKEKEKELKRAIEEFVAEVATASKQLTVDIGLFGRMTTSDLVANVEAACQVAHAISTHETLIESDWFTAMDDMKAKYAATQTEGIGAGYIGSGEQTTFFDSAVYYKYLNLDVDSLKKHLPSLSAKDAAHVAGVLVSAAALATPSGKQNSFAAHGVPELILIEVSKVKRPVSYANAFLQPVGGGLGRNLMTESAKALQVYVDSVAGAYAPADMKRILLAIGPAAIQLKSTCQSVSTLEKLIKAVVAEMEKAA